MNLSRESIAELRHKLRTPLNHILGYSEMLLEEREDSARDPFTECLHSVRRIGRSIVAVMQSTLAQDQGAEAEIDRFRSQIAGLVQDLVRTLGEALPMASEKHAVDVLRMAAGAAELLEFTQQPAASGEAAAPRAFNSDSNGAVASRASVLVIDDDEANRDILFRQLQRSGFNVAAAASGAEGLAKLQSESFDIVLVDFMMPGMDGLEVLETIKRSRQTQDLPVLMISALDELSGVTRCMERGADDYLFKPFEPILLTARISAALERTRLRERERHRTKELERIGQELQRSNEDLKRFAYAASHDLQAPLRTITTHLQLLERRVGKQLSGDDLELIRFPVDAALRMTQLIKDLLTYSQVSTEERQLSPVSCEQVLAATLDDLAFAIEESKAVITHDPLPTVVADAVQLRQLLLNLIGNAIKYRSERIPQIHVGAEREYKSWHFTVRDNGVGIPEQHIHEVFKLFRRLHGHERPGTGLGLAICKRILERVGGQLWAESQDGAGSTFHFTVADEPVPSSAR